MSNPIHTYLATSERIDDDLKRMDVYLRLHDDNSKDYCIEVDPGAKISCLRKIFDLIPLALTPSFFFKPKPAGFHISTEPGFLTSHGGLLFNDHNYGYKMSTAVDENKTFHETVFEGQLFVPIWQISLRRYYGTIFGLLLWLYTDLPDCISPTPGYQLSGFLYRIVYHFGSQSVKDFLGDPDTIVSKEEQYVFFGFHVLKVIVIWLILWCGAINPYKFSPFGEKPDFDIKKLSAAGWTGVIRATPEQWRQKNTDDKVAAAGGKVEAYKKGILRTILHEGVFLGKGEGFDSPFIPSEERKNLDDSEPASKKWVLDTVMNKEELGLFLSLSKEIGNDPQKLYELARTWRRSGPPVATEKIKERYEARKALGDGDVHEKSE